MKKFFSQRLSPILFLLLGVVLGIGIVSFLAAGSIYDFEEEVDVAAGLPEVDVILCLAGARGRIDAASSLWYRYWETAKTQPLKIPVLYVSGMGAKADWKVFASQVKPDVLEVLREEQTILENKSTDTVENMAYFLESVREKGWGRVALVTSSYHVRRSRLILDRAIRSAVQPTPRIRVYNHSLQPSPFNSVEWNSSFYGVQVTLLEYLKYVVYRALF